MLYRSVVACVGRTPLVELGGQFPSPGATVIAKLELMNPSGSMKDRSAAYIVERGLAEQMRGGVVERVDGAVGERDHERHRCGDKEGGCGNAESSDEANQT